MRRIITRSLEGVGHRVVVAVDGIEGLGAFDREEDAIDLVVSDLVMPRLGGKAMLHRLRMRRPNLPALFVSGYADRWPEGLENTRILAKPFMPEQLVAEVHALLNIE